MENDEAKPSKRSHAKICGAKCRDGHACTQPQMPNGRCRMHRGGAVKGIAHPDFKDGRYSKVLPIRLLSRYHEAAKDPDLLVARHEIALCDSRLADLISRVDSGESGELWKNAAKAMDDLRLSRASKDSGLMADALNSLEQIITAGAADYAAWNEIGKLLDRRQRFVESERKRLVEMQQTMTADQANALVAALISAVRKNVTDRDILTRIQADIIAICDWKSDRRNSA